jgi:hypothetical protein
MGEGEGRGINRDGLRTLSAKIEAKKSNQRLFNYDHHFHYHSPWQSLSGS